MVKRIKYVAELAHVREVSLLGAADLSYWSARLADEALVPVTMDGRARVLIVAADSRYKGIRFRELSVSILVAPQANHSNEEAAYLVTAFNSRRIIAFCERVLFKTPYLYGDIRIPSLCPPSIQLVKDGDVVFGAEMAIGMPPALREPSTIGDAGWNGAIFLPRKRRQSSSNLFFARLHGLTRTYPFLSTQDQLTLRPGRDTDVFRELVASNFVAQAWIVREDATHAKSKTYARSESFF
jgi:hypothetical protein